MTAKGAAVNYTVVPMDKTHLEAVAALERQCFSAPWSAQSLAEELDNPLAHFLVAVAGGKTAGYIGAQEIAGECYITNLAVFPEYRRLGIAQALLAAAQNGAIERGCRFITLEVRPSNRPAVALYSKNGFTAAGERRGFYQNPDEDALIMTKYLIQGAAT